MRAWMIVSILAVTFATPALAQESPAPRPTPIGNPGDWIPPNAYPPPARASAEEGRVTFTLDVDETGRAVDCKVTMSSGSPLLDETTCALMSANARFTPPRDKKNRPIASQWSSSVRWKLETAPAPAPAAAVAPPVAPVSAAANPLPLPTTVLKRTPQPAPKPATKPAAKRKKK